MNHLPFLNPIFLNFRTRGRVQKDKTRTWYGNKQFRIIGKHVKSSVVPHACPTTSSDDVYTGAVTGTGKCVRQKSLP